MRTPAQKLARQLRGQTPEQKAAACARTKAWYAANKDRAKATSAAYKESNSEAVKKKRQEHYQANKARILAQQKIYYEANRERIAGRAKEYAKANSAAAVARVAKYIETYPERHRAYRKAWEARNPEAVKRKDHDRRARKNFNGGTLSPGLIARLLIQQRNRCVYCPADISEHQHLDHRIALKMGGLHADENMQLLCPSCNRRKGTLHPDEFRKRLRTHKRFRQEWISREAFITDHLFCR